VDPAPIRRRHVPRQSGQPPALPTFPAAKFGRGNRTLTIGGLW